jgi:putative transposase
MMRGNNRQDIFIDDEDKSRVLNILEDKKKAGEYYLYAYCVMDNHIHMVIMECKDPVARIIKRITASYSHYFNKKYKRIGHVFQERYKSETIEDEGYLLSAIRYVHQNPVKAGIGAIEGYEWSSFRDYLGHGRRLADPEEVLCIFSSSHEKAKAEFSRYNHELTEQFFVDVCEMENTDPSQVKHMISRFLAEKGVGLEELKVVVNKPAREELIKLLLEKTNLSLRGIANELGMNREMVRRVVSRYLSP